MDLPQLSARQDRGYGVFAGTVPTRATVRFSAHARINAPRYVVEIQTTSRLETVSRWITNEQWHPDQQQRPLPDGRLEMDLPYATPRELLMDLRRYGADVEVLAPESLRRQMREAVRAAAGVYSGDGD